MRQRNWNLRLEWKVEDLWIGAFWRRDGDRFDLWVCLLPCVPLHFSYRHSNPLEDAFG